MIQSSAFNYINVLDKASDASWLRETVIANNLANVSTPGYKRREVDFESLLKQQLAKSDRYLSLDKKINNVDYGKITANAQLDAAAYPYDYRLDGNNVDPQTENVELASEQLRYQGLTSYITNEFNRMKTAIGS